MYFIVAINISWTIYVMYKYWMKNDFIELLQLINYKRRRNPKTVCNTVLLQWALIGVKGRYHWLRVARVAFNYESAHCYCLTSVMQGFYVRFRNHDFLGFGLRRVRLLIEFALKEAPTPNPVVSKIPYDIMWKFHVYLNIFATSVANVQCGWNT